DGGGERVGLLRADRELLEGEAEVAHQLVVQPEERRAQGRAQVLGLEEPAHDRDDRLAVLLHDPLVDVEDLEDALRGLDVRELALELAEEGHQHAPEGLAEEALLVAEVPEDGRPADLGARRDGGDTGALVAAGGEELDGGAQDALLRFALARPRARPARSRPGRLWAPALVPTARPRPGLR